MPPSPCEKMIGVSFCTLSVSAAPISVHVDTLLISGLKPMPPTTADVTPGFQKNCAYDSAHARGEQRSVLKPAIGNSTHRCAFLRQGAVCS